MARKAVVKKVVTKGSVIPKIMAKGKDIDPNEKWLKMKADFDLEDDEMPKHLQAEIANWNARRPAGKSGLTKAKPNKPLNHIMVAEATLKSLVYPATPQAVKVCKGPDCGDLFRTSYEYMSYCSDYCRLQGLAGFGIEWIDDQWSNKNEVELWMGNVPPGTIPQSVLAVMKYLVLDSEERAGVVIDPWNPGLPKSAPVVSKPVEPAIERIEQPIPAQPQSIPPRLSVKDRLAQIRRERVPSTVN